MMIILSTLSSLVIVSESNVYYKGLLYSCKRRVHFQKPFLFPKFKKFSLQKFTTMAQIFILQQLFQW